MTIKQREIIYRVVGLLEGFAWMKRKDELNTEARFMDDIVTALLGLVVEEGGAESD